MMTLLLNSSISRLATGFLLLYFLHNPNLSFLFSLMMNAFFCYLPLVFINMFDLISKQLNISVGSANKS